MDALRNIGLLAVLAGLAIAGVGCGDDDDGGDATASGGGDQTTMSAQQLQLTGEDTTLALDPGTAMVLEDNKVKVAPVEPAAPGARLRGWQDIK